MALIAKVFEMPLPPWATVGVWLVIVVGVLAVVMRKRRQ